MIVLTQQAILEALKTVKYPGYSRDVVSFGLVKDVVVNGGAASVSLQLTGGNAEIGPPRGRRLQRQIDPGRARLGGLPSRPLPKGDAP